MDAQVKTALITAISVILGVIISQGISILLSSLDKKHKKHILLRQKYEEMMFAFQDSLRYVQELHTCKTREQIYQLTPPPQTGRAYGLALLYFPDLVDPLSRYSFAQLAFYNSIVTLFNQNDTLNAGGQGMKNHAHVKVLNELQEAKDQVMAKLVSSSKKYIKA